MQDPSRNYVSARRELALELVHATETAALAAAHLLGRGDEERVHEVAGEAMRKVLEESVLSGMVVLGSRNESILPPGTSLGGAEAPLDLGLFPVEGAGQVARGYANAVSIVAAVDRGGFVCREDRGRSGLPRSGRPGRLHRGQPSAHRLRS